MKDKLKNSIQKINRSIEDLYYPNYLINRAVDYSKIYNLERKTRLGSDDETDAFRHAFMQADLVLKTNPYIAQKIGDYHEQNSNSYGDSYITESAHQHNMDYWNNKIGREIGIEIKNTIKGRENQYSKKQIEDMVASKIMERMQKGDLITDPENDNREYKNYKEYFKSVNQAKPTGQAAPIDNIYTREMIGKMSTDEYLQHEPMIMEQLKTQGIPSEKQINQENDLSGFVNEISGNSKIFTREEIKNMSTDEYLKNEKAIDYQLKTIGVPYEKDLNTKQNISSNKSGNKKSSSSSNSGDGRWVTINGNHVLIDD